LPVGPTNKRALHRLSARTIAALVKSGTSGRHSDGGGLYLSIDNEGRQRWVFLYDWHGKRTELGLGGASRVALEAARKKAAAYRAMIADGTNPKNAAPAKQGFTFGEYADQYIEAVAPEWKNPKHKEIWLHSMRVHAAPIRELPIDGVDVEAVLSVLQPIWQRVPDTAGRVRGRIEAILDAARSRGLRTGDNPARWKGHLENLLPKRAKLTKGHMAAAAIDDMPAISTDLARRTGMSAQALLFTILTAARTGETIGATWDEIDLERGLWIIPAARMKAKREHRVALSSQAVELLHKAAQRRTSEVIFPSEQSGKAMSNMAMSALLKGRMGLEITVHGFRSTFRDWAAERTQFEHELAEMALAHTISNAVERAYRRGDMLEKRRMMMQAWADFCFGVQASQNVIPLGRKA
jgi:integrase